MWKVDIYLEADSKAQKNTERKMCIYPGNDLRRRN